MRTTCFKYSFILTMVVFIVLTACRSKAEVKTEAQTKPACKALINFASRGTGIDNPKHDSLITILSAKKLKFTEKVMGREGEKEVCIPLTELAGKEKTEFIERLKKFEDKNTLVSVSIN